MKNGKLEYWACYHEKLGFLRFGSYSKASASVAPDPRGLFKNKVDAEYRTKSDFYVGRGQKSYSGKQIQVVSVKLDWQVDI